MHPSVPHPAPAASGGPPRRRRSRLRRAVLLGLLGLTILLATGVYLVRTPPAHWQRYERFKASHSPQQVEAMAAALEARLNDLIEMDLPPELRGRGVAGAQRPDRLDGAADAEGQDGLDPSMVRIDQVRSMTLSRDELMALVAARHEQWLASRGYVKPDEIADMMVDLEDGRLIASFKYESRHFSQVFSARFRLRFEEDGMAIVHLESFDAGRLPVPSGRIGDYLRDKGGTGPAEQAGEWLAKLDNFRFKPVLDDLPHRRRALVLGYVIQRDQIELTLRVQDFRTYQESSRRAEARSASAMTSGE